MAGTKHAQGIIAASALVLVLVTACSDDTREKIGEAAGGVREDVESATDDARARAAAEAFRAAVKADDLDDAQGGAREVAMLQANAEDLPGDPAAEGIVDADGDGADDDGLVEFVIGDGTACVTLPETGDDIDVTGGTCT
jgi:hypothetical protein